MSWTPRPHVDAVAGVVAHPVLGNPPQRVVDGLDLPFGPGAALCDAQVRILDVVVDEQRVVDLEQEAGVDDGPVLHPERVGNGEQKLFVGLVVLVLLVAGDVAGGDGRHERLHGSGRGRSGLEVIEVPGEPLLGPCR